MDLFRSRQACFHDAISALPTEFARLIFNKASAWVEQETNERVDGETRNTERTAVNVCSPIRRNPRDVGQRNCDRSEKPFAPTAIINRQVLPRLISFIGYFAST